MIQVQLLQRLGMMLLVSLQLCGLAHSQHYLFKDNAPPGAISMSRTDLRGPVQCTYQPVKVSVEGGAKVAIAQAGTFPPGVQKDLYAGLVIGRVYRLQVTEIPFEPGAEICPTIELIDRTYPPAGQEVRFAIPIVITEQDIDQAMQGNLVTRVIYLEDPQTALPIAQQPNKQSELAVDADEDAITVADSLGRPVAIVRFGSRLPPTDPNEMHAFLMGSPQWLPLVAPRTKANIPPGQTAVIRQPHIPRIDLNAAPIPTTNDPSLVAPVVPRGVPFVPGGAPRIAQPTLAPRQNSIYR